MGVGVIYIVPLAFSIYMWIITERLLKEKYFYPDHPYYSGYCFIGPLILPKGYFKKEYFWAGYRTYVLYIFSVFLAVISLFKLLGIN